MALPGHFSAASPRLYTMIFNPLLLLAAAQAVLSTCGTGTKFDYVIIGGGPAGLLVANRLSADGATTVAVIEAMKMQNILKAERDGVVKAVSAKAGDPVAADDVLVEFG